MIKILFTGGGTGGHFYPIIAVAEEINKMVDEQKIANVRMYYFSDAPYDADALFQNQITFKQITAGKMRIYFSFKNFLDVFKTAWGVVEAFIAVFQLYPDVVFAKGAYASFPTLFAARLLRIPVIIHESDSAPGRVTAWAGKFAKYVAVSYKESFQYFPADRTAHIGQPIRLEIERPAAGGFEYLNLEPQIPVIFVYGGSLGAQIINEQILAALPEMMPHYQIVHQTGRLNLEEVTKRAEHILRDSEFKTRYHPIGFLNPLALRMIAGVTNIVITRAGSSLFEIAAWGIPALVVPISVSNNDHQRKNAFAYARSGAGEVIEERNLTPHIILSEVDRITKDLVLHDKMSAAAKDFFRPHAAQKIAEKVLEIGLSHVKPE